MRLKLHVKDRGGWKGNATMPIYTLDTLTTKYSTLGETDKGMNAQSPTICAQDTQELVVIIRPGFKKICDNDACGAAVYNQLLYSVSWRLKQGFDFWYGTVKDIWQSIDESWGLSKVIKEVNALVKSGIIGQRRNPVKGFDQTRQYFFGKEQAQALRKLAEKVSVCLQHMGFPSEVSHLLKLTN